MTDQTTTTDTSTDDTADASETTTPPEPKPAEDATTHPEGDADEADDDGKREGNREAAKYRRRLRETEAQLATAATKLENLQRQQVEMLVAGERHPIKAAALWTTTNLTDVLDDDGTVSAEKVSAAIEATRQQLGISGPPMGNYIPGLGNRPQTMPTLEGLDKMARQIAGRR